MDLTIVSGIDPERGVGGTRRYVLGLSRALVAKGIRVSLVSRGRSGGAPKGVHQFPISGTGGSVRFLWQLSRSAGRLRIPTGSVLHFQRPDELAVFGLLRARGPALCTLHGIPALSIRRRRGRFYGGLYRILEGRGLNRADIITAVDKNTLQWYRRAYPNLADKMRLVPIGVDTHQFRPMDKKEARRRLGLSSKYVVLYAGRLSVEKRVGLVIDAVTGVPEAELLVAGTGPEGQRLQAEAKGRRVRFLGAISDADMPQLLNAADLLVLASEYEGLPTVALEALACGVPIVATAVGDLPDLIREGVTGWLVHDREGLQNAIRNALPQATRLSHNCTQAARDYSWERVADRLIRLYDEVLEHRGPLRPQPEGPVER